MEKNIVIQPYFTLEMSSSVKDGAAEIPPWTTRILSSITCATGIQRKISLKNSNKNGSPTYFSLTSFKNPCLALTIEDSWLP